jgi:hypothetical protein
VRACVCACEWCGLRVRVVCERESVCLKHFIVQDMQHLEPHTSTCQKTTSQVLEQWFRKEMDFRLLVIQLQLTTLLSCEITKWVLLALRDMKRGLLMVLVFLFISFHSISFYYYYDYWGFFFFFPFQFTLLLVFIFYFIFVCYRNSIFISILFSFLLYLFTIYYFISFAFLFLY